MAATPTMRLGAFIAARPQAALPPAVAEKSACCLLDALGLALIARDEQTFRATSALAAPAAPGPRSARIWADGTWASLPEAAAANAVGVHAHFHDDSEHMSWSHPGSLVVPAAVVTAEAADRPLAVTLRALAAGYGTMAWVGAKERVARALIDRGIRTSPTIGTLGAAAAASVALGLGAAQATSAVGIASSITGGVLEPVRAGSDEWRVQNAHAARGGLLAAQLAQAGVAGAPEGLEGPKGFLRSLCGLTELPPEWNEEPQVEAILGVYVKPWATLGDNMAAARAARLVYDAGIAPDAIRRIDVRIWHPYTEYPGTSYRGPFTRTPQALASTAFATAAMLLYGDLEYEVAHERRQDPRLLALVERVRVDAHDEDDNLAATVEVTLADGSRVKRAASEAPRAWLYPDGPAATATFERRAVRAGARAGAGERLARRVLQVAAGGDALSTRELLDEVAALRA